MSRAMATATGGGNGSSAVWAAANSANSGIPSTMSLTKPVSPLPSTTPRTLTILS
jgi:hypothetical protein